MAEKVTNAFTLRTSPEGQKGFDKEYIDFVPKQVVKKTGEGEDDFVLVTKHVEKKRNIDALINSQEKEVGIYNLLDRVAKTGDETLLPKPHDDKNGVLTDLTGYPKDLMEAHQVANAGADAYSKLPKELTKGRSLEEFAKTINDEEATAFIKALISSKYAKKQNGERKDENK